jgi:UDPglucose--hexose-1-phosphate uridylyltransferase
VPELRRDPLSGRLVAVAPQRSRRPGGTPGHAAGRSEPRCPFCEGRERETPPETFALGPRERHADAPGWRIRVVPNKYPALVEPDGRHEVVVHTPRHVESLADLREEEVDDIAAAWQARAIAARESGYPYVHALVNEGREAGGSLPHTHSQLLWLRVPPPAVAEEDDGSLADLLASERLAGRRIVADERGIVAFCPPAGRGPYELLVAPAEPEPDPFTSALLAPALRILATAVRRLQAAEGRVPLNAWLHAQRHWHLELLPRLTVAAGIELGAGIYVNPLPPEQAAEALRPA